MRDVVINNYAKDGGPRAVWLSCSFYHDPLWYKLLYLEKKYEVHIHK